MVERRQAIRRAAGNISRRGVAGGGSLGEDITREGRATCSRGRFRVHRRGRKPMRDMRPRDPRSAERILAVLAGALILKVVASVVANYRHYLPPDFAADFLRGRERHFWGAYRWAFYAHIASGPLSLILGLGLVSERFRRRSPIWHRRLGRVQVASVLLLVVPSG